VREATVVGLPDPEWGELVVAVVVPEADADPTQAAIAAHCDSRLADFERPRDVVFVDSLPRTASGTVDRAAARELASGDAA